MTKPRRPAKPMQPHTDQRNAEQPNCRLDEKPLSPAKLEIWEKAAAFCVRHLPTLWTAGEPRQEPGGKWIVPIVLRYPDGFEGTLGEMAFDKQREQFTLLTERAVLSERARCLASSHFPHAPITASPEAGA